MIWPTPEPVPSSAVSDTLTGELPFQPEPFELGESWALTVGAAVSITMPALACDAEYAASPRAYTVCAPSPALFGIASAVIDALPSVPTNTGRPTSAVLLSSR